MNADFYENEFNQRWMLVGNELVSKGQESQENHTYCLEIFESGNSSWASVLVSKRNHGLNQMWILSSPPEDLYSSALGT